MIESPQGNARIRVAALIVREENILLALHRKKGRSYWLLPGGGVEYGESLEDALERELLEEAGLEIRMGGLLWIVESIPEDRHRHVINLIFSADALSERLKPNPDSVLSDVQWRPIDEIENLEIFPDTRTEILRFIRTGEHQPTLLGRRWKTLK